MAGKIGDSEQKVQIDRIMRVAFRIARDAGATFINLKIENRKLKIEKSNRIENLLCSYPSRLKAVREACGQHTNYWVVLVNSVLNGLSNGMSEIVLAFTSLALTAGGKVMEHPVLKTQFSIAVGNELDVC